MLLYIVTFNLARTHVDPQLLGQALLHGLPSNARLPDVIVCSLQEVSPIAYAFLGGTYLAPYLDRIVDSIGVAAKNHHDAGGEHAYQLVVQRNVGMTAIMVFAKHDAAERIRWIQTAEIGLSFAQTGHKGAVGVRLGYADVQDAQVEMTFVAAHLAPMEDAVQRRVQDWDEMVRSLVFEPVVEHAPSRVAAAGRGRIESATSNVTDAHEQEPLLSPVDAPSPASASHGLYGPRSHVFVAGDLNFRTHDAGPAAEDHLSFPQPDHPKGSARHFAQLLATDQLGRERRAGRVLHGFVEADITFPPTYKYRSTADLVPTPSQAWAWARHRWPSWCDRVLFLSPPLRSPPSQPLTSSAFTPLKYTSLPLLSSSDHQPVALTLELTSASPLAASSTDDHEETVRTCLSFPLSPDWRARRAAARRREIAFGVLAYLTWTYEGNAVLLALAMGAVGIAAVARSFS